MGFAAGVYEVLNTVNESVGVTAIVHQKTIAVREAYEGDYKQGRRTSVKVDSSVYDIGVTDGKNYQRNSYGNRMVNVK